MQPLPPPPGRGQRGRDSPATPRQATIPEGSAYVGENAQAQSQNQNQNQNPDQSQPPKKRKHRGGKKKRNRRQSFAAPSEGSTAASLRDDRPEDTTNRPRSAATPKPFYRLGRTSGNLSSTSLESEALLDHRDQPSLRPRRDSRTGSNLYSPYRASPPKSSHRHDRSQLRRQSYYRDEPDEDREVDPRDSTPLLAAAENSGGYGASYGQNYDRPNSGSTSSSQGRRRGPTRGTSFPAPGSSQPDYDVNNPPSVPGSPTMGPEAGYDDVMAGGFQVASRSPDDRRDRSNDLLIDIDGSHPDPTIESNPSSPRLDPSEASRGRRTLGVPAEEDVCFPTEVMSELAEEDFARSGQADTGRSRRRRHRRWPDLSILEEWSREEKEERSEGLRQMRINEPTLVNGRLRPSPNGWYRKEEVAPYRFTYFNEEFQSTVHAQTISELVQPGGSFQELFIPDPPLLSDSSSDEDEDEPSQQTTSDEKPRSPTFQNHTRASSLIGELRSESGRASGQATPQKQLPHAKPKRFGPRPTFWLDILSPTDAEMRVISKAFGIHALTAEDIMMQEAREKVELFRNYYFINYRSFEQDSNSEDFLEPVDIYVIVFREGVLSFHFSQTPHPANVRRRIRQLKDYLILSSDWISYAIIDDITDVFQPLISNIEAEVDKIDDVILQIFEDPTTKSSGGPPTNSAERASIREKSSEADDNEPVSGMDLLRRVGECRKKVMGLYRLLGNKADVIKGFAKRCNEQWEVAPKSEIGLYLGDIQDHILTMTSNLSHYETLLSRAHSNYLAQINIRMNDRAEQNADVLGKLTVLGTIVLPLNVVCGMFGMNVLVPGQNVDNLNWFWGLTAGMFVFAVTCFFIAKRVYHIV